ncbi:hypothetical protein WN55_05897 [Dufourea novaeangliae]|uniref:Uncharacterized protein n=1 Tax=Dufourea novaeangliae TaxID=178035 RepID=A0A154P2A8_DUFNO|nr:hypothetical protein WN55_05897 [Dufourea novaeangliae]
MVEGCPDGSENNKTCCRCSEKSGSPENHTLSPPRGAAWDPVGRIDSWDIEGGWRQPERIIMDQSPKIRLRKIIMDVVGRFRKTAGPKAGGRRIPTTGERRRRMGEKVAAEHGGMVLEKGSGVFFRCNTTYTPYPVQDRTSYLRAVGSGDTRAGRVSSGHVCLGENPDGADVPPTHGPACSPGEGNFGEVGGPTGTSSRTAPPQEAVEEEEASGAGRGGAASASACAAEDGGVL